MRGSLRILVSLRVIVMLVGLAAVTACNPTPTATPEPSATIVPPTETLQLGRTLPPSWTPGTPPTATARTPVAETTTSIPQAAVPGAKTLPPTWTPFVAPTATTQPRAAFATFTAEPPTPTPAVSPTRSLSEGPPPISTFEVFDREACPSFNPYTKINQYKSPSTQVDLGWFVVPGADSYEIWLSNPEGRFIHHGNVLPPKGELIAFYSLSSKLFVGPGAYAYEIFPMKALTRMCPSITGTIFINSRY